MLQLGVAIHYRILCHAVLHDGIQRGYAHFTASFPG
jgi:hypothetical protein